MERGALAPCHLPRRATLQSGRSRWLLVLFPRSAQLRAHAVTASAWQFSLHLPDDLRWWCHPSGGVLSQAASRILHRGNNARAIKHCQQTWWQHRVCAAGSQLDVARPAHRPGAAQCRGIEDAEVANNCTRFEYHGEHLGLADKGSLRWGQEILTQRRFDIPHQGGVVTPAPRSDHQPVQHAARTHHRAVLHSRRLHELLTTA